MTTQVLTEEEFAEKVSTDKIGLIDRLAGDLYVVGLELAKVSMEYYAQGGRYGKGHVFQLVQGRKAALEWEHDTIRHTISALQSTLKAERIGVMERDGA